MKRNPRRFGASVFLSFLAILVALIVFEIVLRLFVDESTLVRVKHIYHSQTISADGLTRESEGVLLFHDNFIERHALKRKTNSFRIVLLGDSVAFGLGLNRNEIFSYHLEELLNKERDGVEVLNFAWPGYDLLQINCLFKEQALALDPDMILYLFFQNDISTHDFIRKTDEFYEVVYLEKAYPYFVDIPFNAFLMDHAKLYRFINSRIVQIMKQYKPDHEVKYYFFSFEQSYKAMKEMVDASRDRDIQFLVVNMPILSDDYSTHNFIGKFLEMENLTVYNIREDLLHTRPEEIQFAPGERAHLNAYGHEILAALIYKHLKDQKVLPLNP